MPSPRRALLTIAIAAAAMPAAADAAWTAAGTGNQTAKAVSMPAGSTPTASVSSRSVTVSWSASTMPDGAAVSSYLVKRYDTSGNLQAIGGACSGTISALSCTESAVPGGSWRYTVTAVRSNWTGAESAQSSAVSVGSPSLSFSSSTTVTSLPTTLNGSVASFVPGQTVTFRLDDASTGTVLGSTVASSPIPSGGGSNVTVTIPAGTANGAHTVYAVGSGGSDVASAAITVSVAYTATTAAWDVRDASAGGAESNQSAQPAFVDGLTFATGNWPTAFSGTRYVEFNPNSPLPSGFSLSGAAFNFTYAATQAGDTDCFWFEVRRASTGALIPGGTHGSTTSPADCTTGTTLKTTSIPISELNTTDLANDVRIRVYGRSSGARPFTIELATVSGTQQSTSFTLYTSSFTDATSGTPTTTPWSLTGSGGLTYTSLSNWAASFSTSRYLKLTFPSYLPSSATVTGATFTTAYRPTASGHNACWYLEVYSGTTLLGTHGSSAAPISCNSTSTYTTDPVPLPELNTPAKANGAIVKMYFDISGAGTRTTDVDLAQLAINYK